MNITEILEKDDTGYVEIFCPYSDNELARIEPHDWCLMITLHTMFSKSTNNILLLRMISIIYIIKTLPMHSIEKIDNIYFMVEI